MTCSKKLNRMLKSNIHSHNLCPRQMALNHGAVYRLSIGNYSSGSGGGGGVRWVRITDDVFW